MGVAVAKPLDEVLEKEWDATLFKASGRRLGLAPMLGWDLTYHTLMSRGSRAGFPDRVLIRGSRVVFAELKREPKVASPVTAEQRRWLDALAGAGLEVYLWRPSDLDEVAKILSKPWKLSSRYNGEPYLFLADGTGGPWTPGSMWISGAGRYDARSA